MAVTTRGQSRKIHFIQTENFGNTSEADISGWLYRGRLVSKETRSFLIMNKTHKKNCPCMNLKQPVVHRISTLSLWALVRHLDALQGLRILKWLM